MDGNDMKKMALGLVAGIGLVVGGNAAIADAPACSKAKLTGISAMHVTYPDGGVDTGWSGTGHGSVPPGKIGDKGIEGDAACYAQKLTDLEQTCLKAWRKSYCP